MIQATTPTVILSLPEEIDLDNADAIYVTFSQQDKVNLTKENADLIDGHTLEIHLTQTETLMFTVGQPIDVQVNWMTGDVREASDVASFTMTRNLLPTEIESNQK